MSVTWTLWTLFSRTILPLSSCSPSPYSSLMLLPLLRLVSPGAGEEQSDRSPCVIGSALHLGESHSSQVDGSGGIPKRKLGAVTRKHSHSSHPLPETSATQTDNCVWFQIVLSSRPSPTRKGQIGH
jgi:hypothetical protein